MYRFLETICVRNGIFQHLQDHQERLGKTWNHFFGEGSVPDLKTCLTVPPSVRDSWIKCRVIYSDKIEDISWHLYRKRDIQSIALIFNDDIEYQWKHADRSVFDNYLRHAGTDEIIIVKNGNITDSSYANLLFRSKNKWFTPETPLLHGTQRQRLIKSGKIFPLRIQVGDLSLFDRIKMINAMLDMESGPEWPMEVIVNGGR